MLSGPFCKSSSRFESRSFLADHPGKKIPTQRHVPAESVWFHPGCFFPRIRGKSQKWLAENLMLLERRNLAREVALVAVHFVFVNAVRFGGAVENAAHFAEELCCFVFFASSDCGTDAFEFAFDGCFHLAVTGCAADGLACAFCGGFGIGHRSVFLRKRSAEAMNRAWNVNRRLPFC